MANSEIAGLTEDTTPDPTDNIYAQDPAGNVDKRVPLSALPVSTATTAAIAAEAALARNGDNITSGTVADARIASTIARDSEVTSAVSAAVSDTAYAGSWNAVTTIAPSKNAVYDQMELLVPKSLYDANTILIATTDNTPVAMPVAASRIVGRKASGDIDDMTTAELAALFGTPDGTKFLKDDGTLATPAGGSSATLVRVPGASDWGLPGVAVSNWNSSTGTVGSGLLFFEPFEVFSTVTLTKVGRRNVTVPSGTACKARLGIYASHATTGDPTGAPLFDHEVTLAIGLTAGTITSQVVSQVLTPGIYWSAWVCDYFNFNWHKAVSTTGVAGASIAVGPGLSGVAAGGYYSFAYAALPTGPDARSSWTSTTFMDGNSSFYQWTV